MLKINPIMTFLIVGLYGTVSGNNQGLTQCLFVFFWGGGLFPPRTSQVLRVREHKVLGPYVDGLSRLAVTGYKVIPQPFPVDSTHTIMIV